MTYKVNLDLVKKGIEELEKVVVNKLEINVEHGEKDSLEYAIQKALETQGVAKLILMGTPLIEDYLMKNGKKIKERFGIEIQGYTK